MLASDITVEVRDKTLRRTGKIPDRLVKLTGTLVHNGVGSWSLDLPAEHPRTADLRKPGAGIIVTGPTGVLWSGPMTKTSVKTDAGDPRGLVTISGVTDDVLLSDATAWPQPSNGDLTTQALAYDNRSGIAETIMRQYVSANIGPAAPASRRGLLAQRLTLAPDLGRGGAVVKSARFPVLGELLAEIATVAHLGFQVIQRGDVLVFEVAAITDRTRFIRLDVVNGGLASQSVEATAPGATVPIILGQGQGEERTIVTRTNPVALAAEAAWGRKPEVVKDQRNTDDLVELQQAGDAILAERGFAATATKAIPAASTGMRFAVDWNVGDLVTVVVDGQETTSTATQATIMAGPAGMLVGVGIGDLRGFDATAALAGRVDGTEARVSQLERTAEDTTSPVNAGITGEIRMWPGTAAPSGWLLCQGQILARSEYPELFAVVGTAFVGGAAPTAAQFRLPAMQQRVPIGADPTYPLGSYGGSATHTLTEAQMPSHTHIQNAHTHTTGTGSADFMRAVVAAGNNNASNHVVGVGSGAYSDLAGGFPGSNHTHPVNASTAVNQYAGGSQSHPIMQPWAAVNYIIKT